MVAVNSKKICRSCNYKSKKNVAKSTNTTEYKLIKKYTSGSIKLYKQPNIKPLTSINMGKNYANRYILYYSAKEGTLSDCIKVPSFKEVYRDLSNRGIARLMAKNDTAAIADFYEAVQLNNNELVSFNLNLAKQELKLW